MVKLTQPSERARVSAVLQELRCDSFVTIAENDRFPAFWSAKLHCPGKQPVIAERLPIETQTDMNQLRAILRDLIRHFENVNCQQ